MAGVQSSPVPDQRFLHRWGHAYLLGFRSSLWAQLRPQHPNVLLDTRLHRKPDVQQRPLRGADGNGGIDFEEITIHTVSNTNRPPVPYFARNKNADEGTELAFTLSASDPDGGPLIYSATGLPAGATLALATGAFSWTPTYTQAGEHEVTFTATTDLYRLEDNHDHGCQC